MSFMSIVSMALIASAALMAGADTYAQGRDVYGTQSGRAAPSGDVFNSNGHPYGGAHPSRRTGKQAIQDDSIYCQQDPQGNVIPKPYGGTRRNIPCGPEFRPPNRPPPVARSPCPAPRANAAAVIDLVARQTDRARWHEVQDNGWAPGLYVAGRRVETPDEAQLAPLSGLPAEIFDAMACNPSRRFEFANRGELSKNIELRQAIIGVMNDVRVNRLRLKFVAFGFYMPDVGWRPEYGNPAGAVIIKNRGPLTWESNPDRTASSAIRLFLQIRQPGEPRDRYAFGLECLAGMQMVVLGGVHRALGDEGFDRMHPVTGSRKNRVALYGIGVPLLKEGLPSLGLTSLRKHLVPVRAENPQRPADKIRARDMVPGDYVYLSNVPDYAELYVSGAWAGENAIYMGSDRFYGLGVGATALTERELVRRMLADYNGGLPWYRQAWPGRAEQLRWTLLAGPVVSGTPGNAGPYVK